MTVKELMESLRQFSADTQIVVHGYEDGYDEATDVRRMTATRHGAAEWYNGEYDESEVGASVVLISSARRWRTGEK